MSIVRQIERVRTNVASPHPRLTFLFSTSPVAYAVECPGGSVTSGRFDLLTAVSARGRGEVHSQIDPALAGAVRAQVALRAAVIEVEKLRRARDLELRRVLEAGAASERDLSSALGIAPSLVNRLRHRPALRSGRP